MTRRENHNYRGETIVAWLEYIKTHDFKVGDYLVKYIRTGRAWSIEKFNDYSDDDVLRKYKVTYKCELGIPYVQKVKVDGSLSEEQFPLVNIDIDYHRYEIDPDFETYILLGKEDEYDPQAKWRQRTVERAEKRIKTIKESLGKNE